MKAERIKKGSTSFTPYSVASDGTNYYVHAVQRVYRDQGKRLVEVAQKNHDVNASQDAPNRQLNGGREDLTFADGALWACGNNVQVSTDEGETWNVVHIEDYKGGYFDRIVAVPDGIYAGGRLDGSALLMYRPTGGQFAAVPTAPPGISAIRHTRHGLFVGDFDGGVWHLSDGAFKKKCEIGTKNPAHVYGHERPICWDILETLEGSILIVGSLGVYRSTDGQTFEKTTDQIFSLQTLRIP